MKNISEQYTQYIIEHKANVQKAFQWLVDHDLVDSETLAKAASNVSSHDMSKYSDEEFNAYAEYFYGSKNKKTEKEFNYAWLSHIHNNPHHWQHWVLKHDDEPEEALEMPKEYIYEMISDWWSFSFKTNNLYEIFDWYKKHKGMILHENTRKLVEDTLDKIKKILDTEEETK